jgi:hypothetical protein
MWIGNSEGKDSDNDLEKFEIIAFAIRFQHSHDITSVWLAMIGYHITWDIIDQWSSEIGFYLQCYLFFEECLFVNLILNVFMILSNNIEFLMLANDNRMRMHVQVLFYYMVTEAWNIKMSDVMTESCTHVLIFE